MEQTRFLGPKELTQNRRGLASGDSGPGTRLPSRLPSVRSRPVLGRRTCSIPPGPYRTATPVRPPHDEGPTRELLQAVQAGWCLRPDRVLGSLGRFPPPVKQGLFYVVNADDLHGTPIVSPLGRRWAEMRGSCWSFWLRTRGRSVCPRSVQRVGGGSEQRTRPRGIGPRGLALRLERQRRRIR